MNRRIIFLCLALFGVSKAFPYDHEISIQLPSIFFIGQDKQGDPGVVFQLGLDYQFLISSFGMGIGTGVQFFAIPEEIYPYVGGFGYPLSGIGTWFVPITDWLDALFSLRSGALLVIHDPFIKRDAHVFWSSQALSGLMYKMDQGRHNLKLLFGAGTIDFKNLGFGMEFHYSFRF